MKTAKILNWLVVVAGVWEVVAPFILGYAAISGALWDAIIIGVVLIILGAWAALAGQDSTVKLLSWINAVLGLWLVIAPFIISYSSVVAAMWNDIIVGVVVIVLGVWAALTVGSSVGHQTS